jgi:hypothetical protein
VIRSCVHNLSIVFLFILPALSGSGALYGFDEITIPLLPADEEEAMDALADGTLDTSLWNEIRQFYTAPINVPAGELSLLQEIFFSLPDDLPVSATRLHVYEPWGEQEQRRFFEKYPELEPFTPILSFNAPAAPASFPVQAAFFFSRQGTTDTSRQYGRFSIGKERSLYAGGRVDFTDSYGRWQRRSITCSPFKNARLETGNYSTGQRHKLFYGYFPNAETVDSTPLESWVYPSARTWNGVKASASRQAGNSNRLSAEVSFHDRPSERIVVTEGSVFLGRRLSLNAGGSYLRLTEVPHDQGHYYAQGEISCNIGKGWKGSVLTGVAADAPQRVPLFAAINNQNSLHRLRSTITFLPRGFYAPRSYCAQTAKQWSAGGDTLDRDILSTSISSTHRYFPFFSLSPEVSAVFLSHDLCYIKTTIGCSGSFPIAYRLRYTWSPASKTGISELIRHQSFATVECPLGSRARLVWTNSSIITSDRNWRSRTVVSPSFNLSRALILSPLAIMYRNIGGQWERRIGIKQVLTLMEKTFSEIHLEQDVPFYSWERLRAYGTMSFAF